MGQTTSFCCKNPKSPIEEELTTMEKSKMARSEASSSNSGTGGAANRGQSVVEDCGRRKSTCGYCRSGSRSSISHGLWAHSITVDDYQDLLDRGWRRSGCFLYKPEMEMTCCPSYTIRLRANDFIPSKEQLRVSRRIQRFLEGTLDVKNSVDSMEDPKTKLDESLPGNSEEKNRNQVMDYLSDQIEKVMHAFTESGEFPSDPQLPKPSVKKVSQAKKKLPVQGSGDLLYTSSVSFQIAATLGRIQENGPSPKTIAENLAGSLAQLTGASGLSVKACNGHINFYGKQDSVSEGAQLVTKDSSVKNEKPQRKRRRLEIHLKRASFDPEEFDLYRRYQIKVHNDEPGHVTETSYRRFLVDTPLVFVPPTGDGTVPSCGFGSFHQQYVLDGKLVAVGVVDILPKCLSSKYLFWDPDFAFLSLGKYSALQEIGWVKENHGHCSSLEYYYLGYYIHSCNKMRYKAAYRPSELLCPLRYQWVPFDISRPLLDKKRYAVLSDYSILQNEESDTLKLAANETELQQHYENGQEDTNDIHMHDDDDDEEMDPESEGSDDEESGSETKDGDASNILIGLKGTRVRYKDLLRAIGDRERAYLETQLHRYMRVVGAELSERMVYLLG